MNQPPIASLPQERREPPHPQDDAFLAQFDDEVLAHALRTVNWHPKDVAQFLRTAALR